MLRLEEGKQRASVDYKPTVTDDARQRLLRDTGVVDE